MASIWRAGIWFMYGWKNFGKSGFQKNSATFKDDDLSSNISDKTFLITGANSGLGYATALKIATLGGRVVLLCRNKERGLEARDSIVEQTKNNNVELRILDISNTQSIVDFVHSYKEEDLPAHVLVNNAGVMLPKREDTETGLEKTFATNTLGTFMLTNLMLPILQKSAEACGSPARVITVSSGGMLTQKMDVGDFQFAKSYEGTTAYAQTKRHQAYLNEIWAEKYSKDKHVNFYCMHPGWADTPGVQTSMPSFYDKLKDNLRTDAEGADTIIWLAVAPDSAIASAVASSNGSSSGASSESSESDSANYSPDALGSGLFFFDRAVARSHLIAAGTQSSKEDIETLWNYCLEHSKTGSEAETD